MRDLVFLVVLLLGVSASQGHRQSRLFRRDSETRILTSGRLSDGTRFERIQESGNDLPPLPIEEEIDSLSDRRIGHLDDNGDIMVPVDEYGNVLKGFEYLLKPIVVEINVPDSPKEVITDAHILSEVDPNSVKYIDPQQGNNREQVGDEYDDIIDTQQERVPEIPPLPPVDYNDSQESDEDLRPEGKDENEIDVPLNRNELPITPIGEDDNVLKPGVEIPSIPIEYEKVDENNEEGGRQDEQIEQGGQETISETDLSEADIESLANELGSSVKENVINKANDLGFGISNILPGHSSSNSQPPKPSDDLEGVVLEAPDLSEDELEEIRQDSEKPDIMIPVNPPIVEGSIVGGLKPDASVSFTYSMVIYSFLIVFHFIL